jgi:hypothetical protein
MMSDVRFALRILLHNRSFTITATVVLTLGTGATATMFSATNAMLLRPLPYPDANRIVAINETRVRAGFEQAVIDAQEYIDWTRTSPS